MEYCEVIRLLNAKKYEILGELDMAKARILRELSFVDETTFGNLRDIVNNYHIIEQNIGTKISALEQKIHTFTHNGAFSDEIKVMTELKEKVEGMVADSEVSMDDIRSDVDKILLLLQGINTAIGQQFVDGSFQVFTEDTRMTTGAATYKGLTLDEIFGQSIVQGGDFENGMPTIRGVEGVFNSSDGIEIQNEVCDTGHYSLKLNANGSSRFITLPLYTFPKGHIYFSAFRARVDHYEQGAIGVQSIKNRYAPTNTTLNEWERRSLRSTSTLSANTFNTYIGCMKTSVIDNKYPVLEAYIDNVVVLDLTDIFGEGNEPGEAAMNAVYDMYIELKKGRGVENVYTVPAYSKPAMVSDGEALLKFRQAMNNKAVALGMYNSTFMNPSGLPADGFGVNYMTAADAMKLAVAAFGCDKLLDILRAKYHTFRAGGLLKRFIATTSSPHTGTFASEMANEGFFLYGGKGGSVGGVYSPDRPEAGVLNYVALCGYKGKQIALSMMGQWYHEIDSEGNRTGNKMTFTPIVMDLMNAMKQIIDGTDRNNVVIGADLQEATTRSQYPVGVAACIIPEGSATAWAYHTAEEMVAKDDSFAINADAPINAASCSKLLTALLVLDYVDNLSERVCIKDVDLVGGSGQELHPGELITYRDLLYIMLMESNNTAATALGRAVGEKIVQGGLLTTY